MSLIKLLKIKLFIVITTVAIGITLINILGWYLYLPGVLKENIILIIEPKLSTHEISIKLADNGVIKHPKLFEIISKIYSSYTPLKSGEYEFTSSIAPFQVLSKLAIGKSVIHKLVIPEGYMVKEIIDKINSEPMLVGKINGTIPEGYLMPSTYFYSYGDQREKIIDQMRIAMSEALDKVMSQLPKDSPIKTRKDLLIMASIVEKEAGNDLERGHVAAVLINRLNKGMKLQADPTTIYAITEGKYKLKRSLTRSDLKIKSPYNTYHIFGLPVGPIACPGGKSLEAVARPAKIRALYFVVNGQGGHNFSHTLEEHNKHTQKIKVKIKK